jgi:hypothetical protein
MEGKSDGLRVGWEGRRERSTAYESAGRDGGRERGPESRLGGAKVWIPSLYKGNLQHLQLSSLKTSSCKVPDRLPCVLSIVMEMIGA